MPAGPYVGRVGGFELFGVVPPFEVYSVYAAVNGSGLVVRSETPTAACQKSAYAPTSTPSRGRIK
jgi:stringent starvation protein B